MNAKRREFAIVPITDGDDGGLTGGCDASTGNTLGCRLPVDPGLKEQGWEWRCNADSAKLDQVVDSYRELGFEVRLEPINLNGLSAGCGGCKSSLVQSNAVFVRTRKCQ